MLLENLCQSCIYTADHPNGLLALETYKGEFGEKN